MCQTYISQLVLLICTHWYVKVVCMIIYPSFSGICQSDYLHVRIMSPSSSVIAIYVLAWFKLFKLFPRDGLVEFHDVDFDERGTLFYS